MKVRGAAFENGYIDALTLTKEAGRHGNLAIRYVVKDEEARGLASLVGRPLALLRDDGSPMFFGTTTETILERTFAATSVEVRATSDTLKEDEEEHTRIFQKPKKKAKDFLSAEKLKMKNCNVTLADELKSKEYPWIVLQTRETNFAFLKRIADRAGVPLWVIDTNEGNPEIAIKACLGEKTVNPEDVTKCRTVRGKTKGLELTGQKYFPVGCKVTYDGVAYVVAGLKLELVHNAEVFTYSLVEYKEPKIDFSPFPLEKTVKLRAKVEDNEDPEHRGRVKLAFEKEETEDEDEEKTWIPYRPPYAGKVGGVVFIPDKGDPVEVIFTGGECYAVSALRENPLAAECQKVAEKYIGNNTGQRIFWKEKSLEFMSDESRIYMDKEKIELTVGGSKISMDGKSILLETGDTSLRLDGKAAVLKAGTSSLNLDGNAKLKAGGVDVKADGAANVDGSSVKINAGGNVDVHGAVVNLN